MHTILFDIDGTLINTGGAGGSALRAAFQTAFEIDDPGEVPYSGRTDRGIIDSMLTLNDLECSDQHRQRLCQDYLRLLPEHLVEREGRVLEGVRALLDELSGRSNVQLGLLTGNLRIAAQIKLEFFDLYKCFEFGGFGDDHPDRDDVARAAMNAATKAGGETWVIGDTPLDIRCARAIQARVLAVATGLHPLAELAPHEPDLLLSDLSDKRQIVETLFD